MRHCPCPTTRAPTHQSGGRQMYSQLIVIVGTLVRTTVKTQFTKHSLSPSADPGTVAYLLLTHNP